MKFDTLPPSGFGLDCTFRSLSAHSLVCDEFLISVSDSDSRTARKCREVGEERRYRGAPPEEIRGYSPEPNIAGSPRQLEVEIVESLFDTLVGMDRAGRFGIEVDEELYDSFYKKEDEEPVYDDFTIDGRDFFTYEEICKVLDYVDANQHYRFTTLQHRFREVKHRNYIALNFKRVYRISSRKITKFRDELR